MRDPLLGALVAAAVAGVGAAARFLPRRHVRIPCTARPAPAFGMRRLSTLRGGAASDDAEDDFWQEEIRRTKAFYDAPQTSNAKEILIHGSKPEVENAGEEEAFAVEEVMSEDERVFDNAQSASYVDEEGDNADLILDSDKEAEESDLAERVERGELDLETDNGETENAGEEEAWEVEDVMTDAEDETVANRGRDELIANDEADNAYSEEERIGAEEETQSQESETDPTVNVEEGEDELENINTETENAGEEEAWEVENVMDDAEDDMVANQEEEDLLDAEESNGNAEDASVAEVEALAVDASDEIRFYNSIDSGVSNIDGSTTPKGGIASLANGIRKKVSDLLAGKDPQSLLIVTLSAGAALFALFRPRDPETAQTADTTSIIEIPVAAMSESSDLSEEEKDDDETPASASEVADHNLDESWLDKLISLVMKPFGAGA